MFEKASEIRAAQRAKMQERWTRVGREAGREEGRKEARKEAASRLEEAVERFGTQQGGEKVLTMTPEVLRFLLSPDEPEVDS